MKHLTDIQKAKYRKYSTPRENHKILLHNHWTGKNQSEGNQAFVRMGSNTTKGSLRFCASPRARELLHRPGLRCFRVDSSYQSVPLSSAGTLPCPLCESEGGSFHRVSYVFQQAAGSASSVHKGLAGGTQALGSGSQALGSGRPLWSGFGSMLLLQRPPPAAKFPQG